MEINDKMELGGIMEASEDSISSVQKSEKMPNVYQIDPIERPSAAISSVRGQGSSATQINLLSTKKIRPTNREKGNSSRYGSNASYQKRISNLQSLIPAEQPTKSLNSKNALLGSSGTKSHSRSMNELPKEAESSS